MNCRICLNLYRDWRPQNPLPGTWSVLVTPKPSKHVVKRQVNWITTPQGNPTEYWLQGVSFATLNEKIVRKNIFMGRKNEDGWVSVMFVRVEGRAGVTLELQAELMGSSNDSSWRKSVKFRIDTKQASWKRNLMKKWSRNWQIGGL